MESVVWGLLGPEAITGPRRTRTLDLGAAVRAFNDRAVPGLGGVWFGKPLFFSTIGVALAERLRSAGMRVQNIEVANAIEALSCWFAFNGNDWTRNPRLRGATKMRGHSTLTFDRLRKPSFYVTQPMRQATVQPLLALGLVESSAERFNSFTCSAAGHEFIEAVCAGFRPSHRSVLEFLFRWAKDPHEDIRNARTLADALSPLRPLPKSACEFLRERIVQGAGPDASRRGGIRAAGGERQQVRDDSDADVRWDLVFECDVTVKNNRDDGLPNFLGPMTQGPPSGRFIYIDVGKCAGQYESVWERRIKVPLGGIGWESIRQVSANSRMILEARLPGTGKDGGPSCATVHPVGGWNCCRR